ncbi:type B 50S ribosomal protein L31 [Streptomyces sp. NPDC085665]|uniref:type B 50S ribosomal protein L31 n=1 Tax=Streptomyces sp. NPDC085665 TaxID=3365735 RepID=UPI0037D72C90
MKHSIHPESRSVVFRDRTVGTAFLTRSTAHAPGTIEWEDGKTYPLVDVEISSASHPFYTGTARIVDAEGRVDSFHRRYDR